MNRLLATFASAILALFATPAAAETDTYWMNDDWYIGTFIASDGLPVCTLLGGYENGDFFGVHFSPVDNVASLTFTISRTEAANFSPSRTHSLAVTFLTGDYLDKGWGDRNFSVSEDLADATRTFTSAYLEGEVLLTDIAKNEAIAFTMHDGQRVVSAFELKGTNAAITKLRECAYSRQAI